MSNKVSIIIPCYNQGQYIGETIQSIWNQTYQNWECLLINDGSTDETESIILPWIEKDKRFQYFKKPNSGVSATRNYGLQKAKGDYIQFLDADDLVANDKFENSIKAIQKYEVDIVCSNYQLFFSTITITEPPFSNLNNFEFNFHNLARYWNDGFTVPCHCWFFKASLFQNIFFPLGLTAQEDWVVWLLIYKKAPKTFYIDKSMAFYRRNPNGRTATGGFFDETLSAIHYLKPFLNDSDFQFLYESALTRANNGMLFWRNKMADLKKSNTYRFGLLCKKLVKKLGLLSVANKIYLFFKLNQIILL